MNQQQLFVTGTDTEVGKTTITAGLLLAAAQRGDQAMGIKPIAAGCDFIDGAWRNSDALQLQAVANYPLDYQQVNPIALPKPVSPHIAAQLAETQVTAAQLISHCQRVADAPVHWVFVEGAGGWLVPINDNETLADLAVGLQVPVLLVVGVRLGCINHALLTVKAVEQAGLSVAGWVANCIEPDTANATEVLQTLSQRIAAPCLGVVPFMENATPEKVAEFISLDDLAEGETSS